MSDRIGELETKLAEVTAERDKFQEYLRLTHADWDKAVDRAEAAEAKLVEVTAELVSSEKAFDVGKSFHDLVIKERDLAEMHLKARTETTEAALKTARRDALEEAFVELKTYAPHHEDNTGPEHDIGYASGYLTAMNRVRALIDKEETKP